ncbi:hypothetical protein R6Q59_009900 [Mikania micrantha]
MYSTPSMPPWQTNAAMNHHTGHPAYISVPTRNPFVSQSGLPPPPTYVPQPIHSVSYFTSQQNPLSPATAQQSQNQAAPDRKKTEWSPEVREYVQRCFAPENQIQGVPKEEMENRLRKIITDAAQNNQLNLIPWKEFPLPQQTIMEERNRAILTPSLLSNAFVPPVPLPAASGFPAFNGGQNLLRKRKSSEISSPLDKDVQSTTTPPPPWRTDKPTGSLEDRVTFASDKRARLDTGKSMSKSNASLEQRKRRFEDKRDGSNSPRKPVSIPVEPTGPVVGTSQKLEKNYFRLTSAPKPEDVRPLPILRQTLELLKKKWRTESNYVYICDQFKSLRQDLTVQHIKNDFTTNVYEIHARIALEKGDLGEYNQCQTQLRALYKQNLGGHPSEFMAYRILYLIHTCNRTDMNDVLADLTTADKSEAAVQHALNVRSALALGNYHKFFKLYLSVPNMGGYLMDMFIERERIAAMARICKAYKPDVRLRLITEELAFESDEDTARFMLEHNAGTLLQEKEDHVRLLTGKAGAIFEDARRAAFQQVDIKGQI